MTKSLIHRAFTDEAVVQDATSAVYSTKRILDEIGAVQVEVNQDPAGGAATGDGEVVLEGRLSPDAPWAPLVAIPFTDLSTSLGKIEANVPMAAQIQVALRADSSGFDVDTGTTVSVWVME